MSVGTSTHLEVEMNHTSSTKVTAGENDYEVKPHAVGNRAVFVKGRDRFGFACTESAAALLTGQIEKR
jgi:hypothetical protein